MRLKLTEVSKVIMFIAFLAIMGCNSDKNTIIAPDDVSNSMAQMYPGVSKIEWHQGNKGTWEADFKNNDIETTIIFDSIGAFKLKIERVPYIEVPENIHNYFKTNSKAVDLEQVYRYTNAVDLAYYKAKLSDSDINYYFDINGGFIREAKGSKADIEMEMVNSKEVSSLATTNIPIMDLPVDVLNFIAYSHSGYMIESASRKTLCGGIEAIEAIVIKESENRSEDYSVSFIFTNDGKYIRTEQGIDISEIPEQAKQQIETSFKDFAPKSKAKLLTLSKDDEEQYLVYLEKEGSTKVVIIEGDGNIVCEN